MELAVTTYLSLLGYEWEEALEIKLDEFKVCLNTSAALPPYFVIVLIFCLVQRILFSTEKYLCM